MQARLTEVFGGANGDFVLDAGHPGHPARDRLGVGPLVGPLDDSMQRNHPASTSAVTR